MRQSALHALLAALAAVALVAACGGTGTSPVSAPPPQLASIPGGGVPTVRADLAGTGNPWLTLPDHEIDQRGKSVCTGLAQFGTRFYLDVADTSETTSPQPDEIVPDLDRAQTLAAVKASAHAFCPERSDMITW